MDADTIRQVQLLKRMMSLISADSASSVETTERILERLRKTRTNAEFFLRWQKKNKAHSGHTYIYGIKAFPLLEGFSVFKALSLRHCHTELCPSSGSDADIVRALSGG